MVNYESDNTNSDLTPSWPNTSIWDVQIVDDGSENTGGQGANLADGAVVSAGQMTVADNPNNDAWEDGGTQTVEAEISSGSMDLRGRCRITKLSSTGTIIESGSFTGFQTLQAANLTFSPVAPTWSGTEACGNRLAIEWEFENTNGMGMSQTFQIEFGTTTSQVVTTITKDTASCTAQPAAVQGIPINQSVMI